MLRHMVINLKNVLKGVILKKNIKFLTIKKIREN